MESLQSAISAMTGHCYFGSVGLSEAFYSIPILHNQRKYFRFWFNNQKYQGSRSKFYSFCPKFESLYLRFCITDNCIFVFTLKINI